MKTTILKINYVLFLVLLVFATSCSSDDDALPVPIIELETEILDCTNLLSGETLTLEDRNSGIDYIINCVYVIQGDFTIMPGVTIQFATDAGLRVYDTGSIQILGQVNNKVVLTGEDLIPGSWRGVYIDSNDIKNKIENAEIRYAGGEAFNSNGDKGAVIVWSDTHLNMNNTTITNSETYGFNASYGGCELMLNNNTITNCDAPMFILGIYITTISGGSYTGNDLDAIVADRSFIANESHHIWTKLNVPYHFPEGMDVTNSGGKLTIMPGVVMKFGLDSRLGVTEGASGNKPSLIAVGTAAEPIIFTGINEVLGAWRGIYFDTPSPLNEIGFATIEYASNPDQSGAVHMWYGTVLNAHDVTFKDIQNCAFTTETNPNLTTTNINYTNVTNQSCNL